MRRLVAAELHKLLTTRLWLWLLLAAMAITALYASLDIAFADNPGTWSPPLTTAAGQNTLLSVGSGAARPLLAVLAAIGLTGEYRHRTAIPTFLATPHRGRVVAAKLITHALTGTVYGVVCIVVTLAIALPWLTSKNIDLPLTGDHNPSTLAGVVATCAIFALIGVGLGALLRDQVATVVTLLTYLLIVEPVITRIPALNDWTQYLPGSAANALTRVAQTNQTYLPPGHGLIVLAGYAIVLAFAGAALAARRDVT